VLGDRPKAEQQLATLASRRTIVAGSRVNRHVVCGVLASVAKETSQPSERSSYLRR
jgi:hypothetical protein